MKKILLAVAAFVALSLGGLFTSAAQAHGPHRHVVVCRPPVPHCHVYRGCAPTVYRTPYVPYGAGYGAGWQPYQGTGVYVQQPRFGLHIGF
jgi:hypothetical protein